MKRKEHKYRNVKTRINKIEKLHQIGIDKGYAIDRIARASMSGTIKRLKSVYHRLKPKMNTMDFDTLADYIEVQMIADVKEGIANVSVELMETLNSIKTLFWIYEENGNVASRRNTRRIKQLLKEAVIKINREVTVEKNK